MNAKRLLVASVAGAVVLAGVGVWWLTSDFGRMLAWFGTPAAPFADQVPPAPVDYTTPAGWARHPDAQSDKPAAVFFVHPTTFLLGSTWNASLEDAWANDTVDRSVMPGQAQAFDPCCDVYAPRYRQAIFHVFLAKDADAMAALDLAYEDVLRAFEVFLEEIGDRPYILAGHSQGALHGTRLVEERISGTDAEERLVAAYLVGYPVRDQVGAVPICRSPTQTGCLVGWSTMEASGRAWTDMLVWEGGWTRNEVPNVCVNPLTWTVDGAAGAEANLGGIAVEESFHGSTRVPHMTGARCAEGRLLITPPAQGRYDILLGEGGDDWHAYDYALFFSNIEANATARVEAFLAKAGARDD